jgi:hypothetical protein
MVSFQKRHLLTIILAATMVGVAPAQLLHGDRAFPVLNELRWEMGMQDVQSLCQEGSVLEYSKDSLVILNVSFFGSSCRTEIQFDQDLKKIKRVQVKFKEATKALEDTLVQHFTALCGMAPYRTMKEKNLLIVTLRIQIAAWRLPTEIVSLVTGMKGDDIMDLSLMLAPPTKQQPRPEK